MVREEAGRLPLPGSNKTACPSSIARTISEKPAKLGGLHKIQNFILPKTSSRFQLKIIYHTKNQKDVKLNFKKNTRTQTQHQSTESNRC